MPIVKTANFDNLLEGAITLTSQASGIPMDLTRSGNLFFTTIGDTKWLGTGTASVASSNLIIDVKNVFTDLTKKIIIGQRINTSNVASAFRVGGFYNGSAFYEAEFTVAFLNTGTGPAPVLAANTEYYVETIIDFVSGKYAVNVNGQERWSKTYPVATIAQIAGAYSLYYCGTNGTAAIWNAKDYYFAQAVGAEVLNPQGPCNVKAVTLQTVLAPNFYPSIGFNILQSLTGKQTDVFSMNYPNAMSNQGAAAGDIMSTILGIDYMLPNAPISNLEVWASASDGTPSPRSMTGKATSGGVTKTGTVTPMTAAMQYNKFNLQMPLALDGSAWTVAKAIGTNFGVAVS